MQSYGALSTTRCVPSGSCIYYRTYSWNTGCQHHWAFVVVPCSRWYVSATEWWEAGSNLCTHGKTIKHSIETLHYTLDEEIPKSQAYDGKVMLTVLFNSTRPLPVEITQCHNQFKLLLSNTSKAAYWGQEQMSQWIHQWHHPAAQCLSPCGPQSSGPTEYHTVMGDAQTYCIQPGLTTMSFSCLWIIKDIKESKHNPQCRQHWPRFKSLHGSTNLTFP